ncbi:MAG: hypothetical protein OXR82_10040 [Gammaproteobacteria bacterium]|nr:hypothetical protein [Gammaproteobacteria bacterium]MDE0258708.1 hypothetical protein [Gammaproteobacteria bacterium]
MKMGNWHEDVANCDPRTGESYSGDDSHEAREQQLRFAESVRRWDAGDIEGAMKLAGGEDPDPRP